MGEVVRLRRNEKHSRLKYARFLNSFPKLNPGSIVIMFVCMVLMLVATFTQLPVGLFTLEMFINPAQYFSNIDNVIMTLFTKMYAPQIPVVLFIGALLGPRLGCTTIVIYVTLGLFGAPIFASGYGLSMVTEPTFGFIIGFIIAAYIVGKIFTFKINSFTIIFAGLIGVLTIHCFGVLYLIPEMLISGYSIESIKQWVLGLSLLNLPYDIIFSIILCCLARPIKGFLWLAMD